MSFDKFRWALSQGCDEWSRFTREPEHLYGVVGEGFGGTLTWDSSFGRVSRGREAGTVDLDLALWAVDAAEAIRCARLGFEGKGGRIVAVVRTKASRERQAWNDKTYRQQVAEILGVREEAIASISTSETKADVIEVVFAPGEHEVRGAADR